MGKQYAKRNATDTQSEKLKENHRRHADSKRRIATEKRNDRPKHGSSFIFPYNKSIFFFFFVFGFVA